MKPAIRFGILPTIISLIALSSCTEDGDFVPSQYQFHGFEFVEGVKAMNSDGEYVSSKRVFNQEDFLFDKNRGFEPADEIRIISESSAKFIYTSERFGYLELASNYLRTKDGIKFSIEPLNATSDSLYLEFITENHGIKVKAYGIKIYFNEENNLNIHDFRSYDLFLSSWLDNMTSTDTLFLQEFNSLYQYVDGGL